MILPAFKMFASISDIDSLKQKLQNTTNDSLKAYVYVELAQCYIRHDSLSTQYQKWNFQNEALRYTMLGLHLFSRYSDTTGLRISFSNLSKVYHEQKKYSEAKWFILQANVLAREKKDWQNIISTLIELAGIKADIGDYKLAVQDLNEALKLSADNYYPDREAAVQKAFYYLYNRMKAYAKADEALKRHDYLVARIQKDNEAKLLARLNLLDSVASKKKVYKMPVKAPKTSHPKKTDSL